MNGAKLAVMDPRLSNTASRPTTGCRRGPAPKSSVLLAMANVLIREKLYDREFVATLGELGEYLRGARSERAARHSTRSMRELERLYAELHARMRRSGDAACQRRRSSKVARADRRSRAAFAAHNWRAPAAGNLGGWQVARCLFLSAC